MASRLIDWIKLIGLEGFKMGLRGEELGIG